MNMSHIKIGLDDEAKWLLGKLGTDLREAIAATKSDPAPDEFEPAADVDGDQLWLDEKGFIQFVDTRNPSQAGWRQLYLKKAS